MLLVEDDPRDRELVLIALQGRGAEVVPAANDLEAYDAINRQAFDLLIVDVNLGPGTTGFDVARSARIRRPDLPVAYVTALATQMDLHAVPNSRAFAKSTNVGGLVDTILDYAHGGSAGDAA